MSGCEDRITAWFAARSKLNPADFPIGIGDDMAQVKLAEGVSVLITTDILLDGVHFELKKATLKQVGYKAMAASLSDCAAMATVPVAAVVSVALPKKFGGTQLKQLHSGIIMAADRFGCKLVGGDITRWPGKEPFAINVAMLSKEAESKPVRRTGARIGDSICVTGALGGAGCGRHLKFEPRAKEALKIAGMVTINAMIDISDGLSCDLERICRASGVGAIIDAQQIPISNDAKTRKNPLDSALNEGEDFELLFTLSQKNCRRLLRDWSEPVPITRIGQVTNSGKMQIKSADGKIRNLKAGGYDHLR